MKNDFTKARFNLIAIYLLIIGSVISLFSLLIIYQAKDSFADPAIPTDKELAVGAEEATAIAKTLQSEKEIMETEYEIEHGVLYFTVAFTDETEVKVDLLTGEAHTPVEHEGLLHMLSDDFEEMVGWIALLVFLLAAVLCVYVANKTLAPIAHNLRKQKQFVSDAAHELRNPLSALHARIESVLRSKQKSFQNDVLEDLLSETKHLIAISEGLLALEHGEQKTRQMEAQSVDDSVALALKRLQHFAHDKQICIKTDIATTPLTIDQEDLQAILYNLLHNAIKFTNAGGTITLTWSKKMLTVEDTGIGIGTEHIDSIFDRFYKSDTSRSKTGSGLGLALVKEIADQYGATVTVASTLEKGSIFVVTFR